jgi:hypothetical protein
MLRLALGTIAVSRTLWLDAGMGNSLSSDPDPVTPAGARQVTAVIRRPRSRPSTMISNGFTDNNIQTLPASARKDMLSGLSDRSFDPPSVL